MYTVHCVQKWYKKYMVTIHHSFFPTEILKKSLKSSKLWTKPSSYEVNHNISKFDLKQKSMKISNVKRMCLLVLLKGKKNLWGITKDIGVKILILHIYFTLFTHTHVCVYIFKYIHIYMHIVSSITSFLLIHRDTDCLIGEDFSAELWKLLKRGSLPTKEEVQPKIKKRCQ